MSINYLPTGPSTLRYLLVLGLLSLAACSSHTPVQPGYIPQQTTVAAADELYGQEVFAALVDKYQISTNDAQINWVDRVTNELAQAAKAGHNPWHVYVLVDDNFKNAAATRGNYIFIWTGMLNDLKSDDELATILAHEMAHVLAGHTAKTAQEEIGNILGSVAEAVTGQVMMQQGGIAIGAELAGVLVRELFTAILVNPDSQAKEYEADQIGLFLMADAGFDPREAVSFWGRIKYDSRFNSGLPGFLSSHPHLDDRHKKLNEMLPEAVTRYEMKLSNDSFVVASNSPRAGQSYPPPDAQAQTPPSRPDRSPPTTAPNISSTQSTAWKVTEPNTAIHTDPSGRAPVVLELYAGQTLELGRRTGNGWWEVISPAAGYVIGSRVAPAN